MYYHVTYAFPSIATLCNCLETGTVSEAYVTATGFKPATT